jgi:hypothetical protein
MRLLVSALILSLLTGVSAVFAAGVDVSLSSASVVGYTTETQAVDVVVKNTQTKSDTFTLSLFPSQFEKVSPSLESFLLTMAPNEEKVVKLYLTVAIDAEPVSPVFTITAKSTSDESLSDSENLILIIQRKYSVYVPSLLLEKYTLNPDEEVKISAKVFNLDDAASGKHFLKLTVKKGTTIVKAYDDSLDSIGPKSSVDISKAFKLDKYTAPGSYVVDAELRDVNNALKYSKSTNFNVNTVSPTDPSEYIDETNNYQILHSKTMIVIRNDGNVPLEVPPYTKSLPIFVQGMFDPDIEPVTTDSSGTRVIYTWSVPALGPGEQYTISYKIAIWRMWLALGIVAVIGYVTYKWVSKPKIGKMVRHEGEIARGKEIVVLLEVKNRALHEIKDVEVVDVVPQIARVVDKFDTLRPKAKRVPGGTELRWNLGSMRAGEERVVTYRIRSVVDVVGHLALPEAQMAFLDRSKVRRTSVSKQALAKAQ